MTDIIFAQTRHSYRTPETGYGSYYDYFRLAELSGFPICYVDEIDPTDRNKCYIFAPHNGETQAGWPEAKAKIIHWNLEQEPYAPIPGVAETWASDKAFAERIGARYVLMGSHPGLMDYPPVKRTGEYDVIMLSYMTSRREQIAVWLREKGLTLAPNGWYFERHKHLMQSRVMLHVHQNNHRYVAPQRWALAAAYKLPLISEDMGGWFYGFSPIHFIQIGYEHIPQSLAVWFQDKEWEKTLQGYADSLHQFLCFDRPFRREVLANV